MSNEGAQAVRPDMMERLDTTTAAAEATARGIRILGMLSGELTTDRAQWFSDAQQFAAQTTAGAACELDRAFDRWRSLYRSALYQRDQARRLLDDHTQPREVHQHAKRDQNVATDLLITLPWTSAGPRHPSLVAAGANRWEDANGGRSIRRSRKPSKPRACRLGHYRFEMQRSQHVGGGGHLFLAPNRVQAASVLQPVHRGPVSLGQRLRDIGAQCTLRVLAHQCRRLERLAYGRCEPFVEHTPCQLA